MRSSLQTFRIGLLSALVIFCFTSLRSQELSADAVIAKHLESIGKGEIRDKVKNRMAIGTSTFESKLPSLKTAGKSLIVSEGKNLFFIVSLASKEYPFDKIGFFHEKMSLPFVTSGARSPLGAFLKDHEKILSDGLFTGSISTTWPLLAEDANRGSVRSEGIKKIDGKKVYVLDYFPKGNGSSEFTIRMFFDAASFHHVRTEYKHTISAGEDSFGQLGRQAGVRITLVEHFDDFKDESGLTLPHSYQIDYQTDSNSGTYEWVWGITISQYLFNKKYEPDFFSFETK